jgi:hypothetical protein
MGGNYSMAQAGAIADDSAMKKTTVYLTDEQAARLTAVAVATDIPVARLIRRGVDLILAQYGTATTTGKS